MIVRVSPTSAPAWDLTEAALARSKRLIHYPVMAVCYLQVQWADWSTGATPKHQDCEHGALSGLLVSEMLKRSVEEQLLGLGHCVWFVNITSGSPLWRIVRITPTSAPAWDRTGAALASSKCLNHYPVVAAYFWQVWWAGSSTNALICTKRYKFQFF